MSHHERREVSKEKVVELLKRAYADEWIAGYYYVFLGYFARGLFSEDIAELFTKVAKEELEEHTKMIADRLAQLDEDPPFDFRALWDLSTCKFPELPKDPYDAVSILKAGVEAEECAIKVYKELFEYVHCVDPVTEDVVRHILADEEEHRALFNNMLPKQT